MAIILTCDFFDEDSRTAVHVVYEAASGKARELSFKRPDGQSGKCSFKGGGPAHDDHPALLHCIAEGMKRHKPTPVLLDSFGKAMPPSGRNGGN